MEQNKTLVRDLTVGSVPRQLITFAAPLFLSGLLQTIYNMVDAIVVGQFVGSYGLSAVSIGGDILHFLTFIAMGFSNAGQVIISQFIGAGHRDSVRKLIGTLFTFLLSASLVMTAICLLLHGNMLDWINTPPEALSYARDYVLPCIIGLFFIYGYNLVSAILRGMGDSKHPFLFIAAAAVLNLVLDLLFVAVFRWGTFGAALATVIGQGVSFIWSVLFLYRRKEQFGFDFKRESFRIDRQVFRPLLRLGIPMVLQSAAISFSKLFVSSFVNSYGVVASALTGIGNKLSTVTNVFAQAFTTAGSSMVGQAIGAEKYDRVPKVMGVNFVLNGIASLALSAVTILFPQVVFGLFTSDTAVLEMSLSYIPVAVLLYFGSVMRSSMFSLVNGSGNSKLNLAIALLDGVVMRIGCAMFLGLTCGMGIRGFWYGDAFAGFVPFFVGGAYFLSGRWKTRKYIFTE